MRYNNVGKTPSVPTCGTLERLHICKEDIKLWKKKNYKIYDSLYNVIGVAAIRRGTYKRTFTSGSTLLVSRKKGESALVLFTKKSR